MRSEYQEGQGFPEHRHNYSHTLTVVSGEFMVRTGGVTRRLQAGDTLIHYKGTRLIGAAVNGPAVIETDHENTFD